MGSFMGIWIVVFVLAFSLQSHAVLGQSWRNHMEYYRRDPRDYDDYCKVLVGG